MSFCQDCLKGVRYEGEHEGTYETINGIKTYVSTPKTDYPKDKAILYLSDIFGLQLPNNPLLADDYARNGFKVYAPDLFDGDSIPGDALNSGDLSIFWNWLPKHTPEDTLKRVLRVIEGLKEQGVTIFGATGNCYGARLTFDLASENIIKAAVVAHPALVEASHVDTYIAKSKVPLLVNSCEFDPLFPTEMRVATDEKFANFAPGYRCNYWEGAHHGFAARGDPNDPPMKAAKEGSFKSSVEWFRKYM
ncbi:alpha/beta-hydrolase [Russula brevipes]|nr:alpha/beta-hydrolase [Russula brevipes]